MTLSPRPSSLDPRPSSLVPRPTLGVVAICRNEERDLPGFLDCLLPWVDEIVLVDDGSTDQTRMIAKAAGDKVKFIVHPRTEESGFAGLRNTGISEAKSDWILNMDIDERPGEKLKAEILTSIIDTEFNAFRYRRINYFLHRPMKAGGWNTWNRPQLARRGHHRYEGIVHERCEVDGGEGATGQLEGFMLHLNDDGYAERMRKSMQYCQLEADKLLASGRRVTGLGLFVAPVMEFLKKYVLKRGFRDGVPGLIAALHSATATFRSHALAWDEQNRIPREEVEDAIRKPAGAPAKPARKGHAH